jgi:hypothetical protein
MARPRPETDDGSVRHHCARPQRWSVFETALRQAIATQHNIRDDGRMELGACPECGTPYLLQVTSQPVSTEGELSCPRCGTIVVSWEGANTCMAYWYRDGHPSR